jgi:hypothetical protein
MSFTVPLCRGHHGEVQRCGVKGCGGRKRALIRPFHVLWLESHPLSRAGGEHQASAKLEWQNAPGEIEANHRNSLEA